MRKDPAVMETIRSMAKKDWRSYEHAAYPNRQTEIAVMSIPPRDGVWVV